MNTQTVQPDQTLITALPLLIDDVKPAHQGYRVLSAGKWTYYASSCLTEEEIKRFDWLLDEYRPKVNRCAA